MKETINVTITPEEATEVGGELFFDKVFRVVIDHAEPTMSRVRDGGIWYDPYKKRAYQVNHDTGQRIAPTSYEAFGADIYQAHAAEQAWEQLADLAWRKVVKNEKGN